MDPATQSAEDEKLPLLPSLAAIIFKLLNDDENITDVLIGGTWVADITGDPLQLVFPP